MYAEKRASFGTMRVPTGAQAKKSLNEGDENLARKVSTKAHVKKTNVKSINVKSINLKTSPAVTDSAPKTTAGNCTKLKIGLIGFGTVGRSVAKILSGDPNSPLLLTHICNRNIAKKKISGLPSNIRWTDSADEVLSSDVDVVVELIGGIAPAGDWIREALANGKSVVTANKVLISEHGPELLALARRNVPRRASSLAHLLPGEFRRSSGFRKLPRGRYR